MQLIIGNKNYSSWSLRPWLLLKAFHIDFQESPVSLAEQGLRERLLAYSDTAKVPVLIDQSVAIWDSLAICEYLCEHYLKGAGWPTSVIDRAQARAICAEMHSGFAALRTELPMNCRAKRRLQWSVAAQNDIDRIEAIWSRYAQTDASGQCYLFGQFSIADCFFAPVALRFLTYQVPLSDNAQGYCDSLLQHPALIIWRQHASEETEVLDVDEVGEDIAD